MFIGIDLGSRFVKLVYGDNKNNFQLTKYDTILFYKNFCSSNKKTLSLDISKIQKTLKIDSEINKIVSTGYGRNIVAFENTKKISEIVAHYIGVKNSASLAGETNFLILDIGGQDTKIISVKNSLVDDFLMNDKCAAGSGRYLENMAKILDIKLSEIGNFYTNPIKLSNTCAIFGESEIISCIVQGIPFEEIASGVNYSIFDKISWQIKKLEQKKLVFVGGMSQNLAIKKFIEQETNKEIITLDNGDFNGALGCFYEANL